jgi:hypothetical protein
MPAAPKSLDAWQMKNIYKNSMHVVSMALSSHYATNR